MVGQNKTTSISDTRADEIMHCEGRSLEREPSARLMKSKEARIASRAIMPRQEKRRRRGFLTLKYGLFQWQRKRMVAEMKYSILSKEKARLK